MTIEQLKNINEVSSEYLLISASGWLRDIIASRADREIPIVFGEVCRRLEYLQRRCDAAEHCIEVSPCDPDITSDQTEAHQKLEAIKGETQ